MSEKVRHAPFYIMLLGIIFISIGFSCVQYHKLEIAKQEKTIYKLYIECLCQKIEKLLLEQKDNTKYGGEIESITITD